jgi:DNA-binding response OmpR family regulator
MGRGKKFLVIDDEAMLLKIMTRLLDKLGYQSDTAADGPSAVNLFKAKSQEYDAVIIDYNLPGSSCEDLITKFRALKSTIKVVISTGFSVTEIKERLGKIGVDETLQKPFTLPQLEATLLKLLR